MSYTYVIDHEVIVRGTTTIESETELTVEELKAKMLEGKDSDGLPGQWEEDPLGADYGYPLIYGDVLNIWGDLEYENDK